MFRARLVPLALPLCAGVPALASAASIQHSEPLRALTVTAAEKPLSAAPTRVSFNAFSRDFTLELEPNARMARAQSRLALPAGAGAYRGKVSGRDDSWVRLVLTPAGPSGLVFDGETLFGIETHGDSEPDATPTMFRLADAYFAPGELGCEIGTVALDGQQAVAAMAQEFTPLAAAGATLNLDLGVVADFEFAQRFGAAAETALLTRFNNVDGIFSEQLGVQITVTEIDVFTDTDDPFTASGASALLNELANYRGATPAQDAQGLTHLFTGRDLDGSTIGIAYAGAVCATRSRFDTRSFGAGLSEGRRSAVFDSLIAAHEIGHNFGAPHDGDANAACADTPTTFLMAPSISGTDEFSACSIGEMQAEIASATCLTPIGAPNVALVLPAPASSVLAGETFTHTATVLNEGAEPATGVTLTAAAEPGLAIAAANAGTTSCPVAANVTTCALGTLGTGGSRTVTMTLRAADPGTFTLAATVTADEDDNLGDNGATASFTALRAVDLVWSGTSAVVPLNAATTLTATLENTANLAATSVAVTATLAAGLRLDSAELAGTACGVAGQSVQCAPQTLAAGAKSVLTLAVTGLAAGSQAVTITASAAEADRTPADNQLGLSVTVNAPPPADADDGGAGALSWLAVLLLLATGGLRRRGFADRRRPS